MAMNRDNEKRLKYYQREFVERLIEETEQAVAHMLYKMNNNHYFVEDVMIDTWTTLCVKADEAAQSENPPGWVMKTAKYHMLRALEKKERLDEHEVLVLEKLENYMVYESRKETELEEILREHLNDDDRTAVILRYFYNVPYEELAEHFSMSETAVRKKVSRAIKKLRKVVPEWQWF